MTRKQLIIVAARELGLSEAEIKSRLDFADRATGADLGKAYVLAMDNEIVLASGETERDIIEFWKKQIRFSMMLTDAQKQEICESLRQSHREKLKRTSASN